jgi:hypothetical protein
MRIGFTRLFDCFSRNHLDHIQLVPYPVSMVEPSLLPGQPDLDLASTAIKDSCTVTLSRLPETTKEGAHSSADVVKNQPMSSDWTR